MPPKTPRKPRQKPAEREGEPTLITTGADGLRVPECPTDGYCYSECERLGIAARGVMSADAAFAVILARGYRITRSPSKAARDHGDR